MYLQLNAKFAIAITENLLVDNFLNLYGVVVLIVISILCCYVVISHYEDIKDGTYNQREDKDPFPLIVPKVEYKKKYQSLSLRNYPTASRSSLYSISL